MAKNLGFEDKVKGLTEYYWTLAQMDPKSPSHAAVANPDVFYGTHVGISDGVRNVLSRVLSHVSCHGRYEYHARKFDNRNLRQASSEDLAERADVLSVMTAPILPEIRDVRAKKIAELLSSAVAGDTLVVDEFEADRQHFDPQEHTFDPSRALFATFRNGHISSRVLTLQYDSPNVPGFTDPGEAALSFDVQAMFDERRLHVGAVPVSI